MTARVRYDTWGRADPAGKTAPTGLPGFAGGTPVLGTDYIQFGARLYDTDIGAFISADPLTDSSDTATGPNGYAYAGNNPVSHTDPTGLDDEGGTADPTQDVGGVVWSEGDEEHIVFLNQEDVDEIISVSTTSSFESGDAYGAVPSSSGIDDPVIAPTGDNDGGQIDLQVTGPESTPTTAPAPADAAPSPAGSSEQSWWDSLSPEARTGVIILGVLAVATVAVLAFPTLGIGLAASVSANTWLAAGAVGTLAASESPAVEDALVTAAEDGVNLYRGMRGAVNGPPELGSSASRLGARPGVDIPVDENGMVRPGTGGMSVNESPTGMPEFRRPPSFGGSGKNLNMYCISSCDLGPGLQYVPDVSGHGFVEPAWNMSFEEYQAYLYQTQGSWSEVLP